MSTYTNQQIPQTISATELTKHHAQQLIPAFKMFDVVVTRVAFNTSVKHTIWQKGSDLSEDVLSLIHVLGFDPKVKSNRHRHKISYKPYQSNISKNF